MPGAMKNPALRTFAGLSLFTLLAAGCGSSGPVRRISEPAASVQQISVRADGRWDVQLRLNNYSSVPMRFTAVHLQLAFDNGAAARFELQPNLDIGPEAADIASATVDPLPAGRARLASALADGRGLDYTLEGSLEAAPEGGGSRSWTIKRSSALSPVPGLPGTLR